MLVAQFLSFPLCVPDMGGFWEQSSRDLALLPKATSCGLWEQFFGAGADPAGGQEAGVLQHSSSTAGNPDYTSRQV